MRAFICGLVGMFLAGILVPIIWLIFQFGSFFLVVLGVGTLIGAAIYELSQEKEKPR